MFVASSADLAQHTLLAVITDLHVLLIIIDDLSVLLSERSFLRLHIVRQHNDHTGVHFLVSAFDFDERKAGLHHTPVVVHVFDDVVAKTDDKRIANAL